MYSECTKASKAVDFTKAWSNITEGDSKKHLYFSPGMENENKVLQIFSNT